MEWPGFDWGQFIQAGELNSFESSSVDDGVRTRTASADFLRPVQVGRPDVPVLGHDIVNRSNCLQLTLPVQVNAFLRSVVPLPLDQIKQVTLQSDELRLAS